MKEGSNRKHQRCMTVLKSVLTPWGEQRKAVQTQWHKYSESWMFPPLSCSLIKHLLSGTFPLEGKKICEQDCRQLFARRPLHSSGRLSEAARCDKHRKCHYDARRGPNRSRASESCRPHKVSDDNEQLGNDGPTASSTDTDPTHSASERRAAGVKRREQ